MQDGDNKPPKNASKQAGAQRESTNFKYVSWKDIAATLNLPINTEFKRN